MIGEFWRRLKFFVRHDQFERDIEEEMRLHAELAGKPQFGNITLHKEASREMWQFNWLERLMQDARYALRVLRKSPGFTIVAVLSLALGIGTNTAIFTLLNALLMRPLAVSEPDQLVSLVRANLRAPAMTSFPYPLFRDLRDHSDVLTGVICGTSISPNLTVKGVSERVTGEMVSGNFFEALGIQPLAGRLFRLEDETTSGAGRVVVLSHGFWQRRFGSDPSIIGATLYLNTIPLTVIGISPPSFGSLNVGTVPDLRVPITLQPEMYVTPSMLNERMDWWLNIAGRLRPGVTMQQAEASLTSFLRGYLDMAPDAKQRSPFALRVFESERMLLRPAARGIENRNKKAARQQLVVLMGVVAMVLLIACVNLANLLLARTTARQREIAVRLALGASRARLIRQLLTESMLLSAAGGVLGIVLAYWSARVLFALFTNGQRSASLDLSPDWRVLCFTLLVSLLTSILFGLAPAIQSTRLRLTPDLKGDPGRYAGAGFSWRKAMVSSQVALSLVLLVGAGLFLRSLAKLRGMDAGFVRENVLQVSLDPSLSGYKPEQIRPFYRELATRIAAIPGVRGVSFANVGLVSGSTWGSGILVEGYQPKEGDPGPSRNVVGAGYFTVLGIPVIRGRDFKPEDNQTGPHVAIVNERFAHFYFGSENPLGKHIGPGGKVGSRPEFEIVGVAKDGKYSSLREEAQRFWYIPYEQHTNVKNLIMYVRTWRDPLKIASAVRTVVSRVDFNVPIYDVKTLEDQVNENLNLDRILAQLSTFFSILATLIASIGLYGVMAYTVSRRTQEIGIRMALGAKRSSVIGLVMREVALVVALGILMGGACALALSRLVVSMLYDVKPGDGVTLITASLLMATVALVAGFLPARQASRIEPIVALRLD